MPELIEKRTRNSKTHSLGGRKFSWDGTIGSIHYWEDEQWKNIDNAFGLVTAPWNWQMLHAGYYVRVKEDFTAGQIIQFEVQDETVELQPMALEWTNDLDQIQQISMPQSVSPVITNPMVDLLPSVGMLSHQGTIRWNDAYGQGIDFEWKCTPTRLNKILEIENLNNLPTPQQYILDGGNPVLRLNLIFDPPSKQDVDIVVDGQIWNQQDDVQTFKIIEFVKDGEVLWGFMPLKYWGSYEGEDEALEEANQEQSVATLEKRGNKLYISIRVPYSWLQTAIYPVFIDTDISPQPSQVGASADDASSKVNCTWFSTTSPVVTMGSSQNAGRNSGMRFTTIDIVQGATIDVAYITFQAQADGTDTVFRTNIAAEDIDNAGDFSGDNCASFNARPRTSIFATWDGEEGWTINNNYNTDDFAAVVEAVVGRGGWNTGNALVIFVDNDGSDGYARRYAKSFDYDSSNAAKLHIEYTVGAAPTGQPYISRVQGVQGMRSWGGI